MENLIIQKYDHSILIKNQKVVVNWKFGFFKVKETFPKWLWQPKIFLEFFKIAFIILVVIFLNETFMTLKLFPIFWYSFTSIKLAVGTLLYLVYEESLRGVKRSVRSLETRLFMQSHCVKNFQIPTFSGPYLDIFSRSV